MRTCPNLCGEHHHSQMVTMSLDWFVNARDPRAVTVLHPFGDI